nr:4-hydroxy-3-methylbut-2-enyl diphosphate reductase [Clostridia bacterium]
MKTILAENAGFCFGVKRAVNRTMELSDSGVKVVTLGELIHNTHFINELKEKG